MWRITVRNGPKVEKLRADGLEEALDLVEREARVLAAGPGRRTVALRSREFTPQQQVAGRVELAGRGVRAGVDVRGDGAAEAWTGRLRRSVIEQEERAHTGERLFHADAALDEQEERETPYDALRRVVAQSVSVDP